MNKNLNPLNWKRSQQIIGGAVAIVLIGGVTTGVMVNVNHQAQQRKIEQALKSKADLAKKRAEKARQLEKQSEADTKKLLDVAEKTPTDKNIKLAEDSILKINNLGVKKAFTNQLLDIKNRVKLENTAKTAVSNYQKDAMNQDKYKSAQQAISKLTSSYSKGLKDSLNKQLATSKKQADDATKAQQAKSAIDSKAKTTNTNKEQTASTGSATNNDSNNANVASDTQNTVNNDVATGSNSYDGGSQNNYSQGNSNSGSYNQGNSGQGNSNSNANTGGNGSNSNTNTGGNGSNSNNGSNGGGNTGQPSHTTKYLGWVSVDGVRKYTKLCDTVAEAWSFVDSTKNSSEVINLGFDGHSISYGTDTIEV